MARFTLPSALPLFIAAGLCIAAILTVWPEPLAGGWQGASAGAALAGIVGSLPFWRSAQVEAMNDGRSGLGALLGVILAGVLVAETLLHLANAVLPPGRAQAVVVQVTDKYVTRGRRGRRNHYVVTTPVPGDSGQTRHGVGGFLGNSGAFEDYQVGGCMAVRWRPGWWWPVVVRRAPAACPAVARPAGGAPEPPLATPGPAWPQVDAELAPAVGRLTLPPGGLRLTLVATVDASGRITALAPSADSDQKAFQAVAPVLMARPGTLAGPGRVRLWLKLLPG